MTQKCCSLSMFSLHLSLLKTRIYCCSCSKAHPFRSLNSPTSSFYLDCSLATSSTAFHTLPISTCTSLNPSSTCVNRYLSCMRVVISSPTNFIIQPSPIVWQPPPLSSQSRPRTHLKTSPHHHPPRAQDPTPEPDTH